MEILNVIAAAVAGWMFGAIWYSVFGKQWMAAAGLTEETINRKNPVPYVMSFLLLICVSGMMRHIFASSGVVELGASVISGLGLGLFIATPWILTNYLYAQRSVKLMAIDAGYATFGSAVIGLVLNLF